MKKTLFLLLSCMAILLFSCGKVTVPGGGEGSVDTITDGAASEPVLALLPFDEPMLLTFSSGAGAWRTELVLLPDGSFEGHFFDGEMGDRDEEKYPYGTRYVCNFVGSFYNITKISDTSYSLQIKNLECEKAEGEEWIEEGVRFVSSIPYGMEGKDFVFYTPDAPYAELPEYVQLWDYRYFAHDERPEKLGLYSLYSTTGANAFFSQEAS